MEKSEKVILDLLATRTSASLDKQEYLVIVKDKQLLLKMGTLSGEATLPFSFLRPFSLGSTLKGKNLLL